MYRSEMVTKKKKALRSALVSLAPRNPKARTKRAKASAGDVERRLVALEATVAILGPAALGIRKVVDHALAVQEDAVEVMKEMSRGMSRTTNVIGRMITTDEKLISKSVEHEERLRVLERKPRSNTAAKWAAPLLSALGAAARLLQEWKH